MSKLMERIASNGNSHKDDEPRVGYEVIDRERALFYLQFNTDNRKVIRAEVKRISSDLLAGRHKPRVAEIRITADGRCIQGQHTLLAVVDTGVATVCTVHHNASDDEWGVLDTGTKRTVGQTLTRMGLPHGPALGTLTRKTMVWRVCGSPPVDGTAWEFNSTLTHSQLVEYAQEHADELLPHIRSSIPRSKKMPLMPRLWIAAVSVLLEDADPQLGSLFMAQLFDEAQADAMPLLLRKRLSTIAMRSRHQRPGSVVLVAMTVKAFNAWVAGREIKTLAWRPSEEFPQITIPEGVN
jgi:hypothetical protein